MTIINLTALGMTLVRPLFADLSLTISKSDRIGIVAQNGQGKSTLLRCIAGEVEPTTGEITFARGTRVGYVAQNVPAQALDQTLYNWVLAALPPDQAEYESWRVDVLLDDLRIPHDIQHQTLATLSGGWQRTAMLAAAWVSEPDVLLLDEPTNHLDLARIALLESWLAALPRSLPVVIVSHDRAFLDTTTNRTLFLRPEASRVFDLPFTHARQALDEADAADARRFANDLSKAQQLRRQAAKLKNIGINSGSDLLVVKTKQLTERADKMEAAAKPAHRERSAGEIRLTNSDTHAKALISLEDVAVETPNGRLLYRTGRKWINKGDRIVLLGSNGTGKTQLVNLIAQSLTKEVAGIRSAPTVVPAISDQHLSHLNADETAFQTITGQFDIGDQRTRAVLASAGVEMALQDRPLAALSGGQKARLAMLILRLKNPNFYLLDEPTNHLDIDGQEALEDELISHDTSCLLVSHDRHFLRKVGTRFWWIKGKRLEEVDDPEAFLRAEMARDYQAST